MLFYILNINWQQCSLHLDINLDALERASSPMRTVTFIQTSIKLLQM